MLNIKSIFFLKNERTMPKIYPTLPVIPFQANSTFTHPPLPPLITHLNDAASCAMIDFNLVYPATIDTESKLPKAEMEMQFCKTSFLLVIDERLHVKGLISAEDLLGEKPLKVIEERRLPRAEIPIRLVMLRQEEIYALDYQELRHAKVGNILSTLKALKQHYVFVVDTKPQSGEQTIHGLFSLSHISKQLGENVMNDITEARSIAELQKQLKKK
jgi:hypothetical protein